MILSILVLILICMVFPDLGIAILAFAGVVICLGAISTLAGFLL